MVWGTYHWYLPLVAAGSLVVFDSVVAVDSFVAFVSIEDGGNVVVKDSTEYSASRGLISWFNLLITYLKLSSRLNISYFIRLQLLAWLLHSHSGFLHVSEISDNRPLLSSRGSIIWRRNYGAKRRLRAKSLSSVLRIQCRRVKIFWWEGGIN